MKPLTATEKKLARALADMLNPDYFRVDQTDETREAAEAAYNRAFNLLHRLGVEISLPTGRPISAELRATLASAKQ